MNQKYIITGGPGTGKTSIINELSKRSFYCVKENARDIISSRNNDINLINSYVDYENKIAEFRTKSYIKTPNNQICFFDRSVFDCLAYLKIKNLKLSSQIKENIKICNFNKKLFFTPFWLEIYKNDKVRTENIDEAKIIEKNLLYIYKSFGFEPIIVPKEKIEKRVDFIISQCKI